MTPTTNRERFAPVKKVIVRRCRDCPVIRQQTAKLRAVLKKEPGLMLEIVDGWPGQFAVLVNGTLVAQKFGEMMPTPQIIREAIFDAEPAGSAP